MVMIMKATDQRIRAEILARYDVDARRCREVFFPAGQQLHAQDAPLENIFLVISGSIFISKSSSNGLSGASCYECTHGCIGAMEIFLDTMRFDCSSVASTDVTTFLLPIDYVQELLQSSFTFVRQIASDLAEQLQHTAARSVQDAHMDMRILLMVVPQEGQKIIFRQRAAHADGQLALQKLTRLCDALLPRLEQGQRLRRIVIEHAPLRRERHAARRPRKQPHAEGAFELLQRLADGRLRQIELLCRPGDISRVSNCFKYPVLLQLGCHGLTPHQNY